MKKCIVNFEDEQIINKLQQFGFTCIPVISSSHVSRPINAHSDVLYNKTGNHTIIISACQRANSGLLEESGYKVSTVYELKPGYKTECLLNFIINEKYVIRNPETALKININEKTEIIVKQGYTRCSVLQVNSDAFITGDVGIYNSLINADVDCLLINDKNIILNGYDHGFIGGASVKISEKEILFFGDIENKLEKEKINRFLCKYSIVPIYIENKQLTDIGSALII